MQNEKTVAASFACIDSIVPIVGRRKASKTRRKQIAQFKFWRHGTGELNPVKGDHSMQAILVLSQESKAILEDAVSMLRGIRQGKTYNPVYFVGVTMAAEQVLLGDGHMADVFSRTAKEYREELHAS
jgi:hypothetical protein